MATLREASEYLKESELAKSTTPLEACEAFIEWIKTTDPEKIPQNCGFGALAEKMWHAVHNAKQQEELLHL